MRRARLRGPPATAKYPTFPIQPCLSRTDGARVRRLGRLAARALGGLGAALITGNVISLYAKGMTTGDIQGHLAEVSHTDISRETNSKRTDAIVEDMVAWRSRPLDPIYAVMSIDAIVAFDEAAAARQLSEARAPADRGGRRLTSCLIRCIERSGDVPTGLLSVDPDTDSSCHWIVLRP